MGVAKSKVMHATTLSAMPDSNENLPEFWLRLLASDELRNAAPLEKLVIGCELIAALDEAELLAA